MGNGSRRKKTDVLKEGESSPGVKLLRKGGIQAKMGRLPSVVRGKMDNVSTGPKRPVDRMAERCRSFCPSPSILFELRGKFHQQRQAGEDTEEF